jgi:hypothetical protein
MVDWETVMREWGRTHWWCCHIWFWMEWLRWEENDWMWMNEWANEWERECMNERMSESPGWFTFTINRFVVKSVIWLFVWRTTTLALPTLPSCSSLNWLEKERVATKDPTISTILCQISSGKRKGNWTEISCFFLSFISLFFLFVFLSLFFYLVISTPPITCNRLHSVISPNISSHSSRKSVRLRDCWNYCVVASRRPPIRVSGETWRTVWRCSTSPTIACRRSWRNCPIAIWRRSGTRRWNRSSSQSIQR